MGRGRRALAGVFGAIAAGRAQPFFSWTATKRVWSPDLT